MATDARYQAALDYLFSFSDYERGVGTITGAARWDLRRSERLLKLLGNPHRRVPAVHIAGTKGKGSTAAMIAAALSAAGYRTGLFISPHLHDFRERISIDGQLIPAEAVADGVDRLRPVVEKLTAEGRFAPFSTFELLTALAFDYFARAEADFQVLEAGLGGRLDATNVIVPLVSAITSISLDHVQILGGTLEQIAAEKAGIIKRGVPVVSAPQDERALQVIRARCRKRGSELVVVGQEITWTAGDCRSDPRGGQHFRVQGQLGSYDVWIPLLGSHQRENAATALAVLELLRRSGQELDPAALLAGLARVDWPGRLQVLGRQPLVVADGAHNADSAHRLANALRECFDYRRLLLVLGTSTDKDIPGIVRELAPGASLAITTRAHHPRAADPQGLASAIGVHHVPVEVAPDVAAALRLARQHAGPDDLILVTGSLFIAAEAIRSQ